MTRHYIILEANNINDLMLKVNEQIDFDYTPIGGVTTDSNSKFYQAMKRVTTKLKNSALEEHKAWTASGTEED